MNNRYQKLQSKKGVRTEYVGLATRIVRSGSHAELLPTDCCAFSQISCNNLTSKEEILALIENEESNGYKNAYGKPKGFGSRSFFTVCCPGEEILEKTLTEIGFNHVNTFERRTGYPSGYNKLYIYNLKRRDEKDY